MRYETALITGASAGLGEEFAHQLAPRCGRLVLVARRGSRLEDLARVLRGAFPGLEVHVFEVDLANPADLDAMVSGLAMQGLVPDLVVNNAGLGDYGEFATSDWPRVEQMLQVNIRALTRLCHAVIPAMRATGHGSILNVSSIASFLPIPDFAVYAATKAYVTSFSEALRIELQDDRIRVLALCPGPVRTEFTEVARRGPDDETPANPKIFHVSAGQVVAEGLRALEHGRARHVPGLMVAAAAVAISLMPIALLRCLLSLRPRRDRGA